MLDKSPTVGEFKLGALIDTAENLLKFKLDIEKTLEYTGGSHSFDNIVDGVLHGRFDFYPLINSFIVAETLHYPNFSEYHAFLAGGDLKELLVEGEALLVAQAKQRGCSRVSLAGRRGWEKHAKALGWERGLSQLYVEVK